MANLASVTGLYQCHWFVSVSLACILPVRHIWPLPAQSKVVCVRVGVGYHQWGGNDVSFYVVVIVKHSGVPYTLIEDEGTTTITQTYYLVQMILLHRFPPPGQVAVEVAHPQTHCLPCTVYLRWFHWGAARCRCRLHCCYCSAVPCSMVGTVLIMRRKRRRSEAV